jgi:hypothetical protein
MARGSRGRRPVVAACLSLLVVGLGHAYLRRWWRGLGWAALTVGTASVWLQRGTLTAATTGETLDPLALVPVLAVGGMAAADAYVLARADGSISVDVGDTIEKCPHCGKVVDPDLDFCHWCTSDLTGPTVPGTEPSSASAGDPRRE